MQISEGIISDRVLEDSISNTMRQLPKRLLSIDVFRAITMFFMIFVNDVSGVKNIPEWIEHVSAQADGLGFADTIFPIFLFIVGLSLTFALTKRIKRGDSFYKVATYILARSFALLVMGFLHVNLENYNSIAILPKAVWEIFITIAFFLIWIDYPGAMKKSKKYFLQSIGILILLLMAWLFKGGQPTAPVGFKPYWWGILGIIGWSYLVCAFIYLLSRGNFWIQLTAFFLFMIINVAFHTHALKFSLWVIGNAASVALTMGGVVISLLYRELAGKGKDKLLWILFTSVGIAMLIFGLYIRPYAAGISKIRATPAWVAICIGLGILIFELLIYFIDIRGKIGLKLSGRPAQVHLPPT
ncbi:heparan-alpha-glucosaminide N-acetyltransferase domain-containing protein [Ginsengibacter hankyongi]|uniref:heparan-alpha-glucosaminide N-acetyltransferase domain-containing protein n=1 Tax=Ginsengibacter hankyongi TaxID=2607284 RepID=UPI001F4280F1|nr:heparan-alpha-glucosaminide N-acetyltransferase domain-containing protein [Ginsengibacter hankyongi]